MKTEKNSLVNKIAEWSEVPKDVALGMPILTVTGHTELRMENYRAIAEYTDSCVKLRTQDALILIGGRSLQVEYYTEDEMKVSGYIRTVEYQK